MRALAFLLIVMAAFLLDQAVAAESEYLDKCIGCFLYSKFDPVCGIHKGAYTGTYWNMCALECDGAAFLHKSFCTVEDLRDNHIVEKFD